MCPEDNKERRTIGNIDVIRLILVLILLRFLACMHESNSKNVPGKEVPDYIDEIEMENYV